MQSDSHTAEHEGTVTAYILGFFVSIILTLAAYYAVVEQVFTGRALVGTIIGLGVAQAFVQLLFFLHLGKESRPYWNLLAFLFMVAVLIVIVGGSLWIMQNLNYNVMPPMDMHHQGGL